MLNRIYTLAVSAVLLGVLRATGTLVLDRHWASGLKRLAIESFENALIGPEVLARSAVAAAAALLVAVIAHRLISPWFRSPERREAATAAIMVLAFWAIAGAAEVAERTAVRDIMTTRLHLSIAQVVIFAAALGGAVVSFVIGRALGRMKQAGAAVATGAILFAWAITAQGARAAAVRPDAHATPARPNVLLISIDTLRADHLSSYGYARKTSPRIDELASRGILFENAIAQAPNTHPSTASLQTSRYPSDLGGNPYKYIPYDTATVAEAFRDAGYDTAAIVSNVWLKASMGFDQGFEQYDEKSAISEFYADGDRVEWKNAADVTDAALTWLATNREAPFFLWLHYLDPHHPYDPPAEYRDLFAPATREHGDFLAKLRGMTTGEQTRALTKIGTGETAITDGEFQAIIDQYDAEIAYTDAQIGRVIDRLAELGATTNTMIVITADHGEEFRDHGAWGHSHTLHRELIRVPLIIVPPAAAEARRVPATVRSIDVAPTLLAYAGARVPPGMRGVDLLKEGPPRPAISMLMRRSEEVSIEWDGWKLITDFDRERPRLFDLANDPDEQRELSRAEPERVASMLALLDRELGVATRVERMDATAGQLDASTRKQLEALGYID